MKILHAALVFVSLVAVTPCHAMTIRTDVFEEDGGSKDNAEDGFKEHEELAEQFPGRAMLMDDTKEHRKCSATFLRKHGNRGLFITAAHCFEFNPKREKTDTNGTWIQTAAGKQYEVAEVDISWRWHKNHFDGDIAVVTVENFDENIPDAKLYCNRNEVGKMGTLLSSGRTGTGDSGAETDDYMFDLAYQAGHNMIDNLSEWDKEGSKADDSGMLVTDFDDGTDEHNALKDGDADPVDRYEFGTHAGDSGGSLWIDTEDGPAIVGILSFGSEEGKYGSKSYFARVTENLALLNNYVPEENWAKAEGESTCGEYSDADIAKYMPLPTTADDEESSDDDKASDDSSVDDESSPNSDTSDSDEDSSESK